MRDEGVIYVAGHPLLNRRCTRLPGCIRLRNDLYYVEWGVKLYSLTVFMSRVQHCFTLIRFRLRSTCLWLLRISKYEPIQLNTSCIAPYSSRLAYKQSHEFIIEHNHAGLNPYIGLYMGRLKTRDLTSRDWTTRHHTARADIARLVSVFE